MAMPPGPSSPSDVSASAPTCFRHPDRETYVSCVRCGRPACPDCLRSAAVGQQCVECIREANQGTRQTSAFLHEPPNGGFGIFHIAFNMWALIVVGPALERLLGRVRFLTVYLVSALGGSVFFYLIAAPTAVGLGASGAIFGLFGAWFVLAKRLRLDARAVIGLIVLNLVISFTVHGIAWQAHVGGLIAGSALTAAYAYAPRNNRALTQVAATVAMVGLLVAGVVIRDHQLAHAAIGAFP